jgi:uncharacterized delta-60 repeat protein
VTTTINNIADYGNAVTLQPDGKIIVTGYSWSPRYLSTGFAATDLTVVRYNNDGSLDTTFNGSGIVTTTIDTGRNEGWAIALQPNDGKIAVAGLSQSAGGNSVFAVVRYISNRSVYLPNIVKNN